ncbi:MAG: two-component sensor histidine kinase, partial [Muriicola sp.]
MNKRLFVFLVILMSLSLIGIISVQLYWIKRSVDDKEEQFSNAIAEVLNRVTDKIEEREMRDYSDRFLNLKDSLGEFKSSHLSNIFFIDRDINSNEILFYSHGILEEDYNIASTFFD